MKWLLAILVLANLFFFGWTQIDKPEPEQWENRELQAKQITLLLGDLPKPPPTPVEPEPAPADETATEDATLPAEEPAKPDSKSAETKQAEEKTPTREAASTKVANTCPVINNISPNDYAAVQESIQGLKLANLPDFIAPTGAGKYWVYIPPRESLAVAQKKAAELKKLGVDDYFVINDGSKWQNAISLGLFSQKDGADRHLKSLQEQGVKSAILRQRDDGVHLGKISFKSLDEKQKNRVRSVLKGRGELTDVACN